MSRTEVIQVDFGPLHGIGPLVGAAGFNIKVFHQGYTAKERFACSGFREEFGAATKGFEEAVFALQ